MLTYSFRRKDYDSLKASETVFINNIFSFYCGGGESDNFGITILGSGGKDNKTVISFKKQDERDKAFRDLNDFIKENQTVKTSVNENVSAVANDVKCFIKQHRQGIYGIIIFFLVDKFILDGKLTTKIKLAFDKLTAKL